MDKEKKCIICDLPQKDHKTNMHIFGVQIGCPWNGVKPNKDKSSKK
tara:strand:- start:82 stop:219 length:138 start_codon:yes stop_codon:yes gene_type:complete